MKKKSNRVMIGCPIRNRAWILPDYLQNLSGLKYPQELLEYCFIINDCSDNTAQILQEFALHSQVPVRLITANAGKKHSHLRGGYNFRNLAWLRNILLREFIKSQCQYLFSLDSDILVPPMALSRLIAADCGIISALVCNGHELGDEKIYNILRRAGNGSYKHVRDFPRDRIFEIDCTGAAYLIRRDVITNKKVRYSAESGAEDIGFCEAAAREGIKIYCDGQIECLHIMNQSKYEGMK